jgi:hypothetical protein
MRRVWNARKMPGVPIDRLAEWSEWVPMTGVSDLFPRGIHERDGEVYAEQPASIAVSHRPGVYMFRRRKSGRVVYVGMSKDLSKRLLNYAAGATDSGLMAGLERSAIKRHVRVRIPGRSFFLADYGAQRWRCAALRDADLEVRWAYTANEDDARRLEATVIRAFDGKPIWNQVRYTTGVTFPARRSGTAAWSTDWDFAPALVDDDTPGAAGDDRCTAATSDAMKERGLRSSWVPGGCWGCSRFTTKEAP